MGNYVKRNLMNGEQILMNAQIHWAYWFQPFLRIIIELVVAGALLFFVHDDSHQHLFNMIALVLIILAVVTFLYHLLKVKCMDMAITDRRLVIKQGIISVQTFELLLQKAEAIEVEQNFMGRLLGFGTITAIGSGGSVGSMKLISNPNDFRRAFQAAIDDRSTEKPAR